MTGWRPRWSDDVPSLGWGVLEWGYNHFRSPLDDREPLLLTEEQARRVVRFYQLDPLTGERLYTRGQDVGPKGYGKSPLAGFVAVAEFRGPVVFGGWDAGGQPVGHRWGERGTPAPHVQIAAVSEDQAGNTYGAIYGLLAAGDHRAAIDLEIDDGRTGLRLRDMPTAVLEPVTASAGSREGQRLTFAVLDETHLWTKASSGHKLARTILRNLAKMGGTAWITSNAHVIGEGSITELWEAPEPGVLAYYPRPSEIPQADWPPERKRAALEEVYRGAWWIDLSRILTEVEGASHPWEESLRYFFNVPAEPVSRRWLAAAAWDAQVGRVRLRPTLPLYAAVRVARDHRSGALAIAQRQGAKVALRVSSLAIADSGYPDLLALEEELAQLARSYPATVSLGAKRVPGPLVVLSGGGFLEGTAQRLEQAEVAAKDIPDSAERRAKGAEALKGAVERGELVHEGDPELARQLAFVVERTRGTSLSVEAAELHDAPGIFAAMEAVRQALASTGEPEEPFHSVYETRGITVLGEDRR